MNSPNMVGVMVLSAMLVAACASSGEAERAENADRNRQIPPPVTDSSTKKYIEEQPGVRPYLTVTVEPVTRVSYETSGAAALLEKDGVRCYRLALNQDKSLEGTMVYELIVGSSGRVAGVEKMSSNIENERLETCAERLMHTLRFNVSSRQKPLLTRLYVRFDFQREVFDPADPPVESTSGDSRRSGGGPS